MSDKVNLRNNEMEERLIRWFKSDDEATPELQFKNDASWKPYSQHDHYPLVGEYKEHNGSKGFKMMQYLLRQGYSMIDQEGKRV